MKCNENAINILQVVCMDKNNDITVPVQYNTHTHIQYSTTHSISFKFKRKTKEDLKV